MDCHRCCEAAVAFTVITITKKDNIIHDHSYLLSTYWCRFIYETPSVLAPSVMLYYILQTLLLPNCGSGDKTTAIPTSCYIFNVFYSCNVYNCADLIHCLLCHLGYHMVPYSNYIYPVIKETPSTLQHTHTHTLYFL